MKAVYDQSYSLSTDSQYDSTQEFDWAAPGCGISSFFQCTSGCVFWTIVLLKGEETPAVRLYSSIFPVTLISFLARAEEAAHSISAPMSHSAAAMLLTEWGWFCPRMHHSPSSTCQYTTLKWLIFNEWLTSHHSVILTTFMKCSEYRWLMDISCHRTHFAFAAFGNLSLAPRCHQSPASSSADGSIWRDGTASKTLLPFLLMIE